MKITRLLCLFFIFFCIHQSHLIAQMGNDTVVDGVVAVIGGNVVLISDIENQYLQFRSQGNIMGSAPKVKCQILENVLFQKLLLHQSQVDSIKVTDLQVEGEMDRRMRYFISQAGSPERLEEHFGKTLMEIKSELRDVIKEQMLVEQEQQKITKDVVITPSEVKAFFKKIPKDSIPLINAEFEIGVLIKQPAIGDNEKLAVKTRLKEFKERVVKGDDFSTLAVLYSEDPGSSKQGGELGMFRRGDMRPEFEAAAFKLKPGEVSDVVETEDGFHIIQMVERRGEYINVRHILLQPQVSAVNLSKSKLFMDSISTQVKTKKLSFEKAVTLFSDDPNKNSGGLMINAASGNTRFEANQLDPKVFFIIDKLKVEDISTPVLLKTERGKQEYRIYFLKSRTNPHKANLEEDYARIQQIALEKKKLDSVDDWIMQKTNSTYISIKDEYKDCLFQRKWMKN